MHLGPQRHSSMQLVIVAPFWEHCVNSNCALVVVDLKRVWQDDVLSCWMRVHHSEYQPLLRWEARLSKSEAVQSAVTGPWHPIG